MQHKKMIVGLMMSVALLVLAGGVYAGWLLTPPPLPKTPEEMVAMIDSPRFTRLSDAQKNRYYDRMNELGESMTDEQRREMWRSIREDPDKRAAARSVWERRMFMMAKNYVEADEAQQVQILDGVIAMMEARMGQRGRDGGGGGGGGGNREQGNREGRPERTEAEKQERRAQRTQARQDRVEQGNPQEQAYMGEFWKALRERREELGLPPIKPRGGKGGGGGGRG